MDVFPNVGLPGGDAAALVPLKEEFDSIEEALIKDYQIRFTWNDTGGYWKFSVYDPQGQPIVVGIKIVPNFPINLFYGVTRLPTGVFAVMTKLDRIGRKDFANGNATFVFCPVEMEE